MIRYKLKELRNTTIHETKIQQAVQHKIHGKRPKRFFHIPLLSAIISIAILIFVISQLTPDHNAASSTQQPALLNIFHEIDGAGVAYSENFKEMDMQQFRSLRYYNEVSLEQFLLANNVSFPEPPEPFNKEDGTVIAVNDGYFTELQFHFKSGEHFLNISLAPLYVPINEELLRESSVDAAGNPIEFERLNDSATLVKQKNQSGSGLVFTHYFYNKEKNAIQVTATRANEYYSYSDGLLYHIGYDGTASISEQHMTDFVKDFILNNEIRTLDLKQVTTEDNWLNRGGKSMLVCLIISVLSFVIMHYSLKNASRKKTKIIWTLMWLIVHTPILSWLISFNTGVLYQDGFAGIGMLMICFPALIVLGLCIILPRNRMFFIQLAAIHILVYLFAIGCSIYDQSYRQFSNDVQQYDIPVSKGAVNDLHRKAAD
ncbi:hypothetical protein ACTHOQ_05915 [Solibacillus silvestris]|uniref:hypothetical protein n=1 Tax=Solibacillus silvestris TaxID=76853 RepID=UPI003F81266C